MNINFEVSSIGSMTVIKGSWDNQQFQFSQVGEQGHLDYEGDTASGLKLTQLLRSTVHNLTVLNEPIRTGL